tara:strand:+ start:2527 stop:2637 length:111 start_codon:yes stop_codon:yes gene_type:complete
MFLSGFGLYFFYESAYIIENSFEFKISRIDQKNGRI